MTIWKAGMLAVCVNVDRLRTGNIVGTAGERFRIGQIYRVRGVSIHPKHFGEVLYLHGDDKCAASIRFRPLNDAEQDADLIAKIKRCKPARIPHTIPGSPTLAGNATERAFSHDHALGRPFPSLHTQAGNDLLNKSTNGNSFNHGESV